MEPFDLTLDGARAAAQHWRTLAAKYRGDAVAAIVAGRIAEAQRIQATAAEYDVMAARAESITQEQLDVTIRVWEAVRQGQYATVKEAADALDPAPESSC